ncbi:MAG: hypothetical protein Q4A09_06550 [Capnocytophaga felis]|nr:hypothetical protein [Capnocytophaga felis]
MAIDGIKIIDSDLAHDIRNAIMEAYDYNEPLEEVISEIERWGKEATDDSIETEIWTTSYAQTMWEIGQLSEELLNRAKTIIERGADPKWHEFSKDAHAKRQKTLNTFWEKISQPNPKPRKSKNYTKVTDFLFQQDEVFVIKLPNGQFGFTILVDVYQDRGQCYYVFTEINYTSEYIPTLDFLKGQYVFARKGLGFDKNRFVTHKKLMKFQEEFQFLGSLPIAENHRKLSTYSGNCNTLSDFTSDWNDAYPSSKQYKLSDFLKETSVENN